MEYPSINTNLFFIFFFTFGYIKGIKAKNTPEVFTQEHWVNENFLRGKYTLEAIKMGQICPSIENTNSQLFSWQKMLREN